MSKQGRVDVLQIPRGTWETKDAKLILSRNPLCNQECLCFSPPAEFCCSPLAPMSALTNPSSVSLSSMQRCLAQGLGSRAQQTEFIEVYGGDLALSYHHVCPLLIKNTLALKAKT